MSRFNDGIPEVMAGGPHKIMDRRQRMLAAAARVDWREVEKEMRETREENDRVAASFRYNALLWSPDRMEWGNVQLVEVARRLGTKPSQIWTAVKRRRRFKGVAFAEEGEPWLGKRVGEASRKAVRRVDTGEVFPSASEAARRMGVGHANVATAAASGYRAGGVYWEYVDEKGRAA